MITSGHCPIACTSVTGTPRLHLHSIHMPWPHLFTIEPFLHMYPSLYASATSSPFHIIFHSFLFCVSVRSRFAHALSLYCHSSWVLGHCHFPHHSHCTHISPSLSCMLYLSLLIYRFIELPISNAIGTAPTLSSLEMNDPPIVAPGTSDMDIFDRIQYTLKADRGGGTVIGA